MAIAPLTQEQQDLFDAVTTASLYKAERKRRAEAEAKARALEEIADAQHILDLAVRAAVDAGVPLARFREKQHGLHTRHQSTVTESLARTEGLAHVAAKLEEVKAEELETSLYSIEPDGTVIIHAPHDEVDAVSLASDQATYGYEVRMEFTPDGYPNVTNPARIDDPGAPGDRGYVINPVLMWLNAEGRQGAAVEWRRKKLGLAD